MKTLSQAIAENKEGGITNENYVQWWTNVGNDIGANWYEDKINEKLSRLAIPFDTVLKDFTDENSTYILIDKNSDNINGIDVKKLNFKEALSATFDFTVYFTPVVMQKMR